MPAATVVHLMEPIGFSAFPGSRTPLEQAQPAQKGTSRLSPHLHFGEISPRQVVADKADVPEFLNGLKQKGDIIITMWAGDIWKYGEQFVDLLKKAAA